MATFADLKDRGARKVYWLEQDGIPYAAGCGAITDANKATLFTDSMTPQFTFGPGLRLPRRVDSKEIRVLRGDGKTGGFEVELLDYETSAHPDGFYTWLLMGSERSTIGRAFLAEDIEINETNWSLVGGHTMPTAPASPAEGLLAYRGLETVRYNNAVSTGIPDPDTWDVVERSVFHSWSVAHREIGDTGIYPEVTDHPTEWEGRGATLFVTYMDENGALAGTPATARSVAHKTRGVLKSFHEENGVYVLTFLGIDSLLDRNIMRGGARAKVTAKIVVTNVNGAADAPAMALYQEDIGGGNPETFNARVAVGTYSADRFVELVNRAISGILSDDGAAFSGQVKLTLDGTRLGIHYQTDAATAKPLTVSLVAGEMGDQHNSGEWWGKIVDPLVLAQDGASSFAITPDADPTVDTNYEVFLDRRSSTTVDGLTNPVVAIGFDADDSPIADFVTPADGDFILIRSKAGDQVFGVQEVDAVNSTLKLTAQLFSPNPVGPSEPLLHEGTYADPIWVIRPYVGMPGDGLARTGAAGETTLCLLLSTGLSGFNADAIYDSLPEGVGISFPHETPAAGANSDESWIDVGSFERFFGEVASHILRVLDYVPDPVPMRKWLTNRIAFLGGYVVVENGQLRLRKGLAPLQHEGVAVTGDMIKANGGKRGVERTFRATAGGVRHWWNYDWNQRAFKSQWLQLVGNIKAVNKENIFEYEDKGLVITDELAVRLGGAILGEFGLENPIYSEVLDGTAIDLEAGQAIQYSDEGADKATNDSKRYQGLPNLDGTRGHNGTRMMLLSAKYSHDKDTCAVSMMQVRRKLGGFAPAGNIVSYVEMGGATRLTLEANVFGAASDGADASWFAIGDLVRVIRCNPTLAGADPGAQTQLAGLTVTAVLGNTVDLNGLISGTFAAPAAGNMLALIYDEFVSGQREGAKNFCHVSDGTDINGTGVEPYDWGA